MVAKKAQIKKAMKEVPIFASADEELRFWAKHDPWDYPEYWEEVDIWVKHKTFGWVKEDGRVLEP